MTREEAKAFDKAYKRVAIRFGTNVADEVFPELKESEDEKIRKSIIKILTEIVVNTNYKILGIDFSIKDMVAWLEKHKV